jgi:antitoxin component YwqK of YwqJK toxin-antitoxin module
MSIELEELLPRGAILETSPYVAGFADGISVIFLQAGHILFTVDLKNYKVKNVCKGKGIYTAIPYTRASTPLVQVYLDYNIQND